MTNFNNRKHIINTLFVTAITITFIFSVLTTVIILKTLPEEGKIGFAVLPITSSVALIASLIFECEIYFDLKYFFLGDSSKTNAKSIFNGLMLSFAVIIIIFIVLYKLTYLFPELHFGIDISSICMSTPIYVLICTVLRGSYIATGLIKKHRSV